MWKAVGNETVLYGPVVLTGFFLLLLYPPTPSLFLPPLGFGEAGTWQEEEGVGWIFSLV